MKTFLANTAAPFALVAMLFVSGCGTVDGPQISVLPTARPIAFSAVGSAADGPPGSYASTPAIDEWQARNHAEIIGDPEPVIKNNQLTGWRIRWVSNPNPYLLHFAYSNVQAAFSLASGVSNQDVLNRLWAWRAATLGFVGRPVYLNLTSGALTVHTFTPAGANDLQPTVDVVSQLRGNMEQDSQVYGFWYLYHDPTVAIKVDALQFTVPVGFPTVDAYLQHRRELEIMRAPALQAAADRAELAEKIPAPTDNALVMERMVVRSDWLDVQPFSRERNGPVVLVKIIDVKPGTPLEKMGVSAGALLTKYQHVTLAGLTEGEFNQLMKKPVTTDVTLEIAQSPTDRHPREIVIPLASLLRKPAMPAKSAP